MSQSLAYNMDCMEYMKSLPDNAFDLAVCGPPFGDGCSQIVNAERERERERGGGRTDSGSADTSTSTGRMRWSRFGQRFDRYKYPPPETNLNELSVPEGRGPKSTGKKS